VDIPAAKSRGIVVSNIPAQTSGNDHATSEFAKSLLQHSKTLDCRSLLGGTPIPRVLFGKNFTVVGYGAVRKVVVQYLLASGARVSVVRKQAAGNTTKSNDRQWCLSAKPLGTICWLLRGALVVYVGWGPLVEHGAMLEALRSNHIGGFVQRGCGTLDQAIRAVGSPPRDLKSTKCDVYAACGRPHGCVLRPRPLAKRPIASICATPCTCFTNTSQWVSAEFVPISLQNICCTSILFNLWGRHA
jgi:hypothetical protein